MASKADIRLDGKVALITGAGRGIGRAQAITFNGITIRIAWQASEGRASASRSSEHRTIGSIPMRPIAISIRQTVEADTRSEIDTSADAKSPAE